MIDLKGSLSGFNVVYHPDWDALFRSDLQVKLDRGWHTEKCTEADQWHVPQLAVWMMAEGCFDAMYQDGHDVGLLTKADAWYVANIENKEE